MTIRRLCAATMMLTASALATRTASAQAADDSVKLYEEGNALYDQSKFPEAEAKYQAAWDRKQTFDVAGNLGNVELMVKQPRDAAEHLSFALRNFPPSADAKKRAFLEQRFKEAAAQVGAVEVTASVARATVVVDGKEAGTTPLADAVFVDPGEHRIEARLDGYTGETKTVTVPKGERQKIALTLTPAAAGTARPPDATPRPTWPYFVLGGAAVVGIGAGIAFLAVGGSKGSDAEQKLADLGGGNPCGAGTPNTTQCQEIQDLTGSKRTFTGLGVGGLVVGGLSLAGLVVYAVAGGGAPDQPRSGSASKLAFVPIVTSRDAKLELTGRF